MVTSVSQNGGLITSVEDLANPKPIDKKIGTLQRIIQFLCYLFCCCFSASKIKDATDPIQVATAEKVQIAVTTSTPIAPQLQVNQNRTAAPTPIVVPRMKPLAPTPITPTTASPNTPNSAPIQQRAKAPSPVNRVNSAPPVIATDGKTFAPSRSHWGIAGPNITLNNALSLEGTGTKKTTTVKPDMYFIGPLGKKDKSYYFVYRADLEDKTGKLLTIYQAQQNSAGKMEPVLDKDKRPIAEGNHYVRSPFNKLLEVAVTENGLVPGEHLGVIKQYFNGHAR